MDEHVLEQVRSRLVKDVETLRRNNGFDSATAEDLVQDGMLKVLQKAGTYREDEGPVLPWALKVARNEILDCLSKYLTVVVIPKSTWQLAHEALEHTTSLADANSQGVPPLFARLWHARGTVTVNADLCASTPAPSLVDCLIAISEQCYPGVGPIFRTWFTMHSTLDASERAAILAHLRALGN